MAAAFGKGVSIAARRIVFFGDTHIDKVLYGPSNGGYPQRVLDIYANIKRVVDFAIEKRVNYLLFGGDAYDRSKPAEEYRHMFRTEILRAAAAGITCVLITGNHDQVPRQTADHALAEFRDMQVPNIYFTDVARWFEFDDLAVYCLPWQYTDTLAPVTFPAKFSVCMAHCTVLGATYQSGRQARNLHKDFGVDLGFFTQFDLAYLAHIHAPQVLNEKPFVGYPGSAEWLTWGEFGQLHGWFYYDGGTTKLIPYTHRPRFRLTWDGMSDLPSVDPAAMYEVTLPDHAVARANRHFRDCFELRLIPQRVYQSRREVAAVTSQPTKYEQLKEFLADDWSAELEADAKELFKDVDEHKSD